jgi:hypothetical protein
LRETAAMLVKWGDPVRGSWLVSKVAPLNVWVDASGIAVGVVLECDGAIIEDAAWLRPRDDSAHINRSELDAAIRGINLALLWGRRELTLITDSATVHGWLQSVVNCTHNVKTRALSEVLIRRRLDTVRDLITELRLVLKVRLVPSVSNLADRLTRVPKHWLNVDEVATAGVVSEIESNADTNTDTLSFSGIKKIHDRNHFGFNRTLELARERYGAVVSRKLVKKVVARCDRCARVDPSINLRWDTGTVNVPTVWARWAVDITYVTGRPHLSVIDSCSCFTLWRRLERESAREVCAHLRQLFSEFGPPNFLLTDNGTIFRSQEALTLLRQWDVKPELACAYRSKGNGKVERVHRTIKRAVKRTEGSVDEAVFWYNSTCGENPTSPFEMVFGVRPRKPGVSNERIEVPRTSPSESERPTVPTYHDLDRNPYMVGDQVYLRPPSGRCDVEWSGPHRVTSVRSSVSVELGDDGVSRHISHVRLVPVSRKRLEEVASSTDDDEGEIEVDGRGDDESDVGVTEVDGRSDNCLERVDAATAPRRSTRHRQPPVRFKDYQLSQA